MASCETHSFSRTAPQSYLASQFISCRLSASLLC